MCDWVIHVCSSVLLGTYMLVCPWRRACHTDLKHTRPEKASVGSAIAADSQWNRSRVSPAAPDHTEIESPMMFIAAKPATASARISRPSCGSFASSRARSEEHTSELQSLMRISYAVFCLKKKKKEYNTHNTA